MKKRNKVQWTWRGYALQLSVVIIGIMVTFIGSGAIDRWRLAKQEKATMQLVYEELKTNRENLKYICGTLLYDQRGMALISSHEMNYTRVPVDSLREYRYLLGQMRDFALRTDALEVLKVSGTISSVADRKLLLDVLECYSWMSRFCDAVKSYNNQKMSSLNHLFSSLSAGAIGSVDPLESWRAILGDPMCAAFIGTMGNYFSRELISGGAERKVDHVMTALNDKYRFE